MLIIILILLLIDSVILAIMKKDVNSLLIFGLCGSLIVMLSGIIIYTAKIGGLSDAQTVFLFLSVRIQDYIQYMIITLDRLGYMIAVGRYLFPLFLLLISLKYSTVKFFKDHSDWIFILFIAPAASLILYYPKLFFIIVFNRFLLQQTLMSLMLVWILLYLVVSILLLIREYTSIPIPYFRRQFRCIFFLYVNLALLYGINCLQDPVQVYQLYGAEYLWVGGISYTNPSMPMFGWSLLTIITLLSSVLGFWNLISYTQINFKANQEDTVMQRKFDVSSSGASIFVHSIKNQLLSAGVVHKRIDKLFEQDTVDLKALKENTDLLNQLNENMLVHMNQLYASTKMHSLMLKPVLTDHIIKLALEHFKEKYPENTITLHLEYNPYILADQASISEALYNLLVNAQEAVINANKQADGKVELRTYEWRIYTVFEVIDNGKGISKNEQKKILDPFYTTKNTNFNWGMGLHYAQRIVKSHFGALRFESTPGIGTKFYIMLPSYSNKKRTAFGLLQHFQ
jgi:signal transduction histidine kinase